MKKMTHSITINAPVATVWRTLWNSETYTQWTTPFCEGSFAETDNWEKGSKVLFLDPKRNGLVSIVEDNVANRYMSFRHIGEVKNGIEDTTSEQVKVWAGAHENYTLTDHNGSTHLLIELEGENIPEEFQEYFAKTWPLALDKLKQICEA